MRHVDRHFEIPQNTHDNRIVLRQERFEPFRNFSLILVSMLRFGGTGCRNEFWLASLNCAEDLQRWCSGSRSCSTTVVNTDIGLESHLEVARFHPVHLSYAYLLNGQGNRTSKKAFL